MDSETETVRPYPTAGQILDAHAHFGQLNKAKVREAMGPNWPREWEDCPEGDFIFEPVQ